MGRDASRHSATQRSPAGSALAFINPWICVVLYVFVAAMWLVPDRRIERQFNSSKDVS